MELNKRTGYRVFFDMEYLVLTRFTKQQQWRYLRFNDMIWDTTGSGNCSSRAVDAFALRPTTRIYQLEALLWWKHHLETIVEMKTMSLIICNVKQLIKFVSKWKVDLTTPIKRMPSRLRDESNILKVAFNLMSSDS